MVFTLYSQGMGEKEVVNELTRLGRRDGKGNVKWSCVKISRILRNATYMGYICYNKSKVNNFLEKKRIKNLDENSIVLLKGNFEPIVSEELFHYCENIRLSRIQKYAMPNGETRRRGASVPQHLWVKKLRCRCGAGYNRFKWRVLKNGEPVYGYQCNYRTQNPAKSFVEAHNLEDQKSCDAISICEWKLDLMAKRIFEQLWGDQRESVIRACKMIDFCAASTAVQAHDNQTEFQKKIDRLEQRILNYGVMRADGELGKEQYQALYKQAEGELHALKNQLDAQRQKQADIPPLYDVERIKKALYQVVDVSGPRISNELIDEFVEVVTPVENHFFRWKLNFGIIPTQSDRCDLTNPQVSPLLSFTIDFESAKLYRQQNQMPTQFRKVAWNDLNVEIYL